MITHGTLITLDIEQLGQLVEERVLKVLKSYTPPIADKIREELPELATRQQVCNCLHITLPTLHRWAQDSDEGAAILVPLKVGRRVLYRREDVLAVAKENRRFRQN